MKPLISLVLAVGLTAQTSAQSPLSHVAKFIEDDAIVVAHLDLKRFEFEALFRTAKGFFGPGGPPQDQMERLREQVEARVKALRDCGVESVILVVPLRDLAAGPYLLAPTDGKATSSQAATELRNLVAVLPDADLSRDTSEGLDGVGFLGPKTTLERLQQDNSGLSKPRIKAIEKAWAAAGDTGMKIAFIPTEDNRRALREMMPPMPNNLSDYSAADITAGAKWAVAGLGTNGGPTARVVIQSDSGNAAKRMAEIIDVGLDSLSAELTRQMGREKLEQVVAIRKTLTPSREQDQLVLNVSTDNIKSIVDSVLAPARGAAQQAQAVNQLKQLALSMFNFESAYGSFPPSASYDNSGKQLLSWRVFVLPFLEESELYEKFHLDQPWDSEHNRKLIQEMPDVFKHPSGNVEAGKTVYLLPIGKEMAFFGKTGTRLQDITDGTSRTILMVEVAPEHAVIWTKPSDWEVNLMKPFEGMLGDREKFIAARCDGSVQTMSKQTSVEEMRALLTKAAADIAP